MKDNIQKKLDMIILMLYRLDYDTLTPEEKKQFIKE